MPLTVRAEGSAPPDVVWARYTEPERWPTWAPHMKRAEYPYPRVLPGTFGRVYAYGGLSLLFSIDAVDEAERVWDWSVYLASQRVELQHGVVSRGSRTRAWARIGLPLPLALGYAPMAKLALRRLVGATSTSPQGERT